MKKIITIIIVACISLGFIQAQSTVQKQELKWICFFSEQTSVKTIPWGRYFFFDANSITLIKNDKFKENRVKVWVKVFDLKGKVNDAGLELAGQLIGYEKENFGLMLIDMNVNGRKYCLLENIEYSNGKITLDKKDDLAVNWDNVLPGSCADALLKFMKQVR